MDTEVKLPPNGKPYNLLTVAELESFDFYRNHGGKMGINVSLKAMFTEHVGVQLIVVIKSIKTGLTAERNIVTEALLELNSSHADNSYKERLQAADAKTIADLYLVQPIDREKLETIELHHQYKKVETPVMESNFYNPQTTAKKNAEYDFGCPQFIPAPKTFMDRVKILFGFF